MNDNYYRILGLDNFAQAEEVRLAYRKLAKKYHPDRNPDKPGHEEKFKRISEAYRKLTDATEKLRFDEKLRHPEHPPTRPQYSKQRTPYATKTKGYTPLAWMYGKVFIILFIMSIVLIPLTLLYQSSVRYYEKGMKAYEDGHTMEALLNFNNAMTRFGGRSFKAGIKATETSIYNLNDYKQALFFANRTMEFTERAEDFAYLYFLRGTAYQGQSEPQRALHDYKIADSLHYNQDSLQLKLGLLNAFSLERFYEAQTNFNYLIDRNVKLETGWFGKAWCQQQLNQYQSALASYSKSLSYNDSSTLGHYYRGRVYLQLRDTARACSDFKQALDLGYSRAKLYYNQYCIPDSAQVSQDDFPL